MSHSQTAFYPENAEAARWHLRNFRNPNRDATLRQFDRDALVPYRNIFVRAVAEGFTEYQTLVDQLEAVLGGTD